jgi:hypothetical protein
LIFFVNFFFIVPGTLESVQKWNLFQQKQKQGAAADEQMLSVAKVSDAAKAV